MGSLFTVPNNDMAELDCKIIIDNVTTNEGLYKSSKQLMIGEIIYNLTDWCNIDNFLNG